MLADDPPEPAIQLCPNCHEPMGITAINAAHGQEQILFYCGTCGSEEMQENKLPE